MNITTRVITRRISARPARLLGVRSLQTNAISAGRRVIGKRAHACDFYRHKSSAVHADTVFMKKQTAVIVVDLQEEFVYGIESMLVDFPNLPANVTALLKWARNGNECERSETAAKVHPLRIVHIRELDSPTKSIWAQWWSKLNVGKSALALTTKAAPFSQEVGSEPVILKHSYDAFHNPENGLHEMLQSWGTKRLLICGCLTKACVMFTANTVCFCTHLYISST